MTDIEYPYDVAWRSVGSPLIEDIPTVDGIDAHTGRPAAGWPVAKILGASFTDWDRLPHHAAENAVVTPALKWALHAEAAPKTRVWLTKSFAWAIDRDGAEMLGELYFKQTEPLPKYGCIAHPDRLFETLATAVNGNRCVVVPLRGQIHVMPWAQWGSVATERWCGPWDARHADAVVALKTLRDAGFGETALREPAPPGYLTAKLGLGYTTTRALWARTGPLRAEPERLDVALTATRTRKTR